MKLPAPSGLDTDLPSDAVRQRDRRLPWLFMLPGDVGLFLKGARTDARIEQIREQSGARAAFEAAYADTEDPWCSEPGKYRYQSLKYDRLVALLPPRRFARALDLGCGTGLLSQRLAGRADEMLGVDISACAVSHAQRRNEAAPNMRFIQGDVLKLPDEIGGGFDLIVLADVLYYLSPLDDTILRTLIARIAGLLAPGGICLLANHYFFAADRESRVSRRIHAAFATSPHLATLSQHRRAFFLASLFTSDAVPAGAS